jgi:hypothetical protein
MLQKFHNCLFGILAVLSLMLGLGNLLPQPTPQTRPTASPVVCDLANVTQSSQSTDLTSLGTQSLATQLQELTTSPANTPSLNKRIQSFLTPLLTWLITGDSPSPSAVQVPARNCGD